MQDSPESAHSTIILNSFLQDSFRLIFLSWSCDLVKQKNGKVPHAITDVCAEPSLVPFQKQLRCPVFIPLDNVWGSETVLYLCQLPSMQW